MLLDAGTNPQGVIYLQECVDPTICGQTGGYVYADFDPMGSPVTDGCTVTSYGACAWWACSNPTTPGVSAGALAVTGGTLTSSLNVPFMGTSYTYTGSLYFASGDVVSVTAAGGVVSPFGPLSVTAPSTLTLTKPTLGGALTISTATDLSVAWTGGQAGNLAFVEGAASNGQSFFLCEWDGATGIGVVPQAVLAPLKGQTGAAFVYGQEANATPIVVGLYTVSLQAAVYGGSSATFQ